MSSTQQQILSTLFIIRPVSSDQGFNKIERKKELVIIRNYNGDEVVTHVLAFPLRYVKKKIYIYIYIKRAF